MANNTKHAWEKWQDEGALRRDVESAGKGAELGAELGRFLLFCKGYDRETAGSYLQNIFPGWPTRELASGDTKAVSLATLRSREGERDHGTKWNRVAKGIYAALAGHSRALKVLEKAHEENELADLTEAERAARKAEEKAEKAREKAEAEKAGKPIDKLAPAELTEILRSVQDRLTDLGATGPSKAVAAAITLTNRWILAQTEGDAANESQQETAAVNE